MKWGLFFGVTLLASAVCFAESWIMGAPTQPPLILIEAGIMLVSLVGLGGVISEYFRRKRESDLSWRLRRAIERLTKLQETL